MKQLNDYRMNLVLVGVVAAIIFSGRSARADFTFGEPTNLGPIVNSSTNESSHSLSADGLELYLASRRAGGFGGIDLWVTTRPTTEDEWDPPKNLGPDINSSVEDMGVCLSQDGLELYFQSVRAGGYGQGDIWVTKRTSRDESWDKPENLGPLVNSGNWDYNPCLSSDGLELYFAVWPGIEVETSLVMATRETTDDPWENPTSLGSVVNNWANQHTPWISSDGLLLMFSDVWLSAPRPGGLGGADIWFSRRVNKESEWCEPVNAGALINTATDDECPMISADGSTLYFNSERSGGFGKMDLWQAPIIPIVDLNADGIVDALDMCIMVDNWGTDNSLCDIGPMPWGDGIVDVQDLIVLADHLFEEVTPVQ
jgi:hypothetical protein